MCLVRYCAVLERCVDLHRVGRCALSSSQHDTDLEDRVHERTLGETMVVSEFGEDANMGATEILTETLSPGGYRLS